MVKAMFHSPRQVERACTTIMHVTRLHGASYNSHNSGPVGFDTSSG